MYLKGLELQGFKSFPDRIRLDFNKGITAVVGPNGSGKSNISDAVRWVLGEKSAKSLRGAKMEDIIFSGTAEKRAMGFAEVTLIMDNSDRVLNVDYSEVSVTRKVYRTGESEYLINGSSCRQRDILELFMDTGIGKEGYSIIGQGRIDEIVSGKSEDRRTLFEEAAGIVKYKARCRETELNLEHTQQNLVRVNDIISELETQVGPLEKQAEKTKKYRVLYEKLKNIQISMFVEDADKYEEEIKLFDEQLKRLGADMQNSRAEQNRLENSKEAFKNKLAEINAELDNISASITEKRAETEKRNGDIRLCDNNAVHINERIEQMRGEIEASRSREGENRQRLTELKAGLAAKGIELKNKTDKYNSCRSEMDEIGLRLSEGERQLDGCNREIIEKLDARNGLNARLSELTAVLKQYEESDKSSNNTLSAYDGRQQHINAALAVEMQELERVELEGAVIAENTAALGAEGERLKKLISDTRLRQQSVLKSINEKKSRLRVLTELKNDYEGYYGGVKAILRLRDNKTDGFEGIHGAVGEVLDIPRELETAIETALGSSVQNIITDNEDSVKNAIAFLKRTKAGRATFLPMNAVKGRAIGSERAKIVNAGGVLGIAKELVSYDAVYEGIISSLLERVIVVDNIDNAIALARQTRYAYKIVTVEGELFNAGGSVTGGSSGKKSSGIFSRTREINELEDSLNKLNGDMSSVETELEKMTARAEDIEESLAEAREEMQRLAVTKNEHSVKAEHIRDELARLEKEKQEHLNRMEELSRNIEKTQEQAEECKKMLSELDEEIEHIKARAEDYSSLIESDKQSRDTGSERLILLSGELNTLKGEYASIEDEISRIKDDTSAIDEKNSLLASDIEASLEKLKAIEAERSSLSNEAKSLEEECEALAERQRSLAEDKRRTTAASDDYEGRIRSVIQSASALEREHTRISGKKEQTEQRSRELYDRMFESYEITYVAAKAYPAVDMKYAEKKREESRLKDELRQLGSVNVNAVEEYNAVKERYDQYMGQRSDITDTEKKLKEIITQLKTLMEVQFKEQFGIISENFSRVFAEMFGGGKAKLRLADEEDVLNCGIEIEAQPPGKALQNMMLLSGGEKAMTAISLLFSILEMKPSPFCILDEIEAALDEANVVRFAEYLRNFTDTTQFIVITHRPGTREAADTLYGVTQENGISKLFSTNIEEIMKESEASGTV